MRRAANPTQRAKHADCIASGRRIVAPAPRLRRHAFSPRRERKPAVSIDSIAHRHTPPKMTASDRQLQRIAHAAARLMAEQGISDFRAAKRKAVHTLGLSDNVRLPGNGEVDAELRAYQRIFQNEEHTRRIRRLRQTAREVMARLQEFRPYLAGPVLDGSAGRNAEIDIQLFADSAKDVEIYLLNARIDYAHSPPRNERAEAVLTIPGDKAPINLVVYPRNEERVTARTRDGRIRPRMRLDALNRLLAEDPETGEAAE